MKFTIKQITIIFFCITLNSFAENLFKTIVETNQREKSKIKCDKKEKTFGKTFFSIRPQDSNSVRRIINLANNSKLFFDDQNNFAFNLTFEYQKTLNSNLLSKWFFFNNKDCMTIGTPGQNFHFDIDANQLGIGHTGEIDIITGSNVTPGPVGTVCIAPEISNFVADFEFDIMLDQLICGLWSRISLPIVQETVTPNLIACPSQIQQAIFKDGLFNFCCTNTESPFKCLLSAFEGDQHFGVAPKLKNGKFTNQKMKKTGLASIIFDLAYDFAKNERTRFSFGGHLVIPTGNEPTGEFMLEPVIGANQSWQLGFIINGIHDICTPDLNKNLSIYWDATIAHLFKSNQKRVFALKDKPGSQFLLLKKFDTLGNVIDLERAANVFLGETKIGANIMVDASFMMQLKCRNYFLNAGYNFWYRSKEKRDEKILFNNFTENTFGIKGNTLLSKIEVIAECPLVEECSPVQNTASKSTISHSAKHDDEPTFLNIADIDFNAALHPNAYSNKFFSSIGYMRDCCRYSFSFELGTEIEIGKNAVDQWGIFLNTAFIF